MKYHPRSSSTKVSPVGQIVDDSFLMKDKCRASAFPPSLLLLLHRPPLELSPRRKVASNTQSPPAGSGGIPVELCHSVFSVLAEH